MRLDDCEEEESEGTREARAGRGGGEEEKEETRGQETDEEKMEKDVERGGEKREGDARTKILEPPIHLDPVTNFLTPFLSHH